MDGFTATRKYRNAVYYITVKNPNHVEKGVQKLTVNGEVVDGTCVKTADNVKEYHVEVVMDKKSPSLLHRIIFLTVFFRCHSIFFFKQFMEMT